MYAVSVAAAVWGITRADPSVISCVRFCLDWKVDDMLGISHIGWLDLILQQESVA